MSRLCKIIRTTSFHAALSVRKCFPIGHSDRHWSTEPVCHPGLRDEATLPYIYGGEEGNLCHIISWVAFSHVTIAPGEVRLDNVTRCSGPRTARGRGNFDYYYLLRPFAAMHVHMHFDCTKEDN